MPILPISLTQTLVTSLAAVGDVGTGAPQFARGVANGVSTWAGKAMTFVTGAGTIGTGVVSTPLVIPSQLLIANMLPSFARAGILGVMAQPTVVGLCNGLALGFSQGVIFATIPGVGSGAGVAKITGPLVVPEMVAGFAEAGVSGSFGSKLATAIGIGLQQAFAVFSMPVPIVGPSGSAPGSGAATGKIV
jgi:hypothetical protein